MKVNFKFIILIIIPLIFLFFLNNGSKFKNQNKSKSSFGYKNNGFADIKASYTLPEIHENLVTPQEADYIITTAKKSFTDSTTIGGFDSKVRKSKTTWLYRQDPIIDAIIKRVCDKTGYPVENAEPMQVVEYEPGGFYKEHHDSCCDSDPNCNGFVSKSGQRVLTILIYLNDDFTGGSTSFPELKQDIKPPKYGGVIFRPLAKDSNKCHPLALHKGTPVKTGIKYVCNIWIREGPYER
jgi:prolyl 4-hydroxylase